MLATTSQVIGNTPQRVPVVAGYLCKSERVESQDPVWPGPSGALIGLLPGIMEGIPCNRAAAEALLCRCRRDEASVVGNTPHLSHRLVSDCLSWWGGGQCAIRVQRWIVVARSGASR